MAATLEAASPIAPTDEALEDLVARTIPRGSSRHDDSGDEPAVDPEVWRRHVAFQSSGCPDALAELVEEYRGYALALARRWHREGEPLDDLRQVAMEALITALQRFDCERGTPFPGFATPTIIGALKRHYRDQGWALRVPRQVHEMAGATRDAADRLSGRLGRPPTTGEVATELGVDETTVRTVETATRARSSVALDAPVGPDATVTREISVEEADYGLVENRVALAEAVQTLDDRAREVLDLYFFQELTQAQIAARFGVSQMQVSRWITSALKRLRARMRPDADDHEPALAGAGR